MDKIIYLPIAFGIIGLIYMLILSSWVKKQDAGEPNMKKLAGFIKQGALAFLKAEYKILAIFVVIAGAALGFVSTLDGVPSTWFIVIAFVIGAVFSAIAGNIGMRIATEANVRTTQAARTSLPKALKVSFGGGTVMGLGVAGLAVFGLSVLFTIIAAMYLNAGWDDVNFTSELTTVLETLAGFSIGAESIALFARVGGGIYTKAADVGADLVGKVEANIPEDDPRNPATIADNVGDNVGDVAGMGADLFGSYVATMLAAMVLGNSVIQSNGPVETFGGLGPVLMPVMIAGLGIIFSIIGTLFVRVKDNNAKEKEVQRSLNIGNWGSIILTGIACFFVIPFMLGEGDIMISFFNGAESLPETIPVMNVFYAVLVGLVTGGLITLFTEHYTGLGKHPVLKIVQNSSTGA
ncbi:MAG: sodium/proton-translocating pyrophosphatase, partial [Flavobacteriales bacterium]|nr:sodium/proton-translocating pyrophosphatase [Flavobacteriales bacterium]